MSLLELLLGTGLYLFAILGIGVSFLARRRVAAATTRRGDATAIVSIFVTLTVFSLAYLSVRVLYPTTTPVGLKYGGMLGVGGLAVSGGVGYLLWQFSCDLRAYLDAQS